MKMHDEREVKILRRSWRYIFTLSNIASSNNRYFNFTNLLVAAWFYLEDYAPDLN